MIYEIVFENKNVENNFRNKLKNGSITKEDLTIIKDWYEEMSEKGPQHIEDNKKWDDHALNGKWEGYRSSCFSNSGRIIYKVLDNKIVISVARITDNHNYDI